MKKVSNIFILLFIAFFATLQTNAQTIDVITGISGPSGLILNGNELFFSQNTAGKISKIDIPDNSPVVIDVVTGLNSPDGILLNGNDLYIAEYLGNKITKIDISDPNPVAIDVVTGINLPFGLALHGTNLYFSEYGSHKISKIDITNIASGATDVLTGLNRPVQMVVNGDYLYFGESNGKKISKIDLSAAIPVAINITSLSYRPFGLALQGNDLYYSNYIPGTISKIDITDDSPVEVDVITGIDNPIGIVISPSNYYIAERGANKISRVVIDNVNPVAICQDISLEIDTQGVTITGDQLDGGSSDNVGITEFLVNGETSINFTLDDIGVNEVTLSVLDLNGNMTECTANVTLVSNVIPIKLNVKIYLQGSFMSPNTGEETLMRDDLRAANLIPTTSPYIDNLTCNASIFTVTGNDAIVDWVWVELRDKSDNTSVLHSTSALLQRDGDIVDIDGTSVLSFNTIADNYFIAIKHRNHLGIMSSNSVTLSGMSTTVDFTDAANQITFGTNAQTTFGIPSGKIALWTGNVNDDTVIQYSGTNPDTPDILSEVLNDPGNFLNLPTYVINGYKNHDVNMDGITQYLGTNPDVPFILQNVLAHPGNFLNFSTFQITEQLPEN